MVHQDIDIIIERYAEERKHESRKVAQEHFLSYVYVVCGANEAESVLKQARSLVSYHISTLSLFDNPFRNSQFCWLVVMLLWFCLNLSLIVNQELCLFGMINCAGTAIFGRTLWNIIWSKWIDTNILIAYYRELVDLIDNQQNPTAC